MNEMKAIEISTGTIVKVLLILGVFGLAFILKDVFVLILLAFIFATALAPFVTRLQKLKIPRSAAVLIIFFVVGLVVFFLFRAVIPTFVNQLNTLAENSEFYLEKANNYFNQTPEGVRGPAQKIFSEFPETLKSLPVVGVLNQILGIFSGLIGLVTVIILTFYFLLDEGGFERTIIHYMPEGYRKRGVRVLRKVNKNIGLWFRGMIIVSATVGLASYIGLAVLKVDFALTLALFAAFCEFIPILGAYLAGGAAALIAFLISPTKALSVVVLYVIIQAIEGHFLVPQVMKKTLGLSPAFIIISLLIGARLFGIVGVLLAVPVASILSVIIEEIHEYDKIEEEERKKIK